MTKRPAPRFDLAVFDVGNVLLKFDVRTAARNFDRLHPGAGGALCERLWTSKLGERLESGRLTGAAFFAQCRRKLGLSMTYAGFCRAFNDIFTPIPENIAFLQALSARMPVALLSNTNDIHWRYMMRRYPALARVKWPLASHILRALKPDPAIYRALERKTGVPLRRMIYVDDREDCILSARRLGMTAIHYLGRRPLPEEFRKAGLLPGKNRG